MQVPKYVFEWYRNVFTNGTFVQEVVHPKGPHIHDHEKQADVRVTSDYADCGHPSAPHVFSE
jgi:hypothetical protein